jgi:hypothetical protein
VWSLSSETESKDNCFCLSNNLTFTQRANDLFSSGFTAISGCYGVKDSYAAHLLYLRKQQEESMDLNIEKHQMADGNYEYRASCDQPGYRFTLIGKGKTATEADENLRNNLSEMKNRLDEIMQISKVSA